MVVSTVYKNSLLEEESEIVLAEVVFIAENGDWSTKTMSSGAKIVFARTCLL